MEIRLIQSHIEAQLLCIERQLFCTELGHIGLIQSYIKTSPYHSNRRLPSAFREAGIFAFSPDFQSRQLGGSPNFRQFRAAAALWPLFIVLGTYYPQQVVLFSLIPAPTAATVNAVLRDSGEISPQ